MNKVIERIGRSGLIPVIAVEDAVKSPSIAKAIISGGLDIVEITMRTDAGIDAIRRVKDAYPGMLVGAGTVLDKKKAKQSVDAGAEFIVSPGFNPEVVGWCLENKIVVTPGCITPTEIEKAMSFGLDVLKFFPASVYGGVKALKALSAPYREVKFIPTGGVSLENLDDYSDKSYVHAIGGGWLCSEKDIATENYKNISAIIKSSIDRLLGFELAHIGVNTKNSDEAMKIAKTLSDIFKFKIKEGSSSIFSGQGIEVNKKKAPGNSGHIAIATNSIGRASYYLEKNGFGIDWNTLKEKNKKIIAVYLKKEIGDFAIHLLQKQ